MNVGGVDFLVTVAGTVTTLLETTSDSLVCTFPSASTVTLGFMVDGLLVTTSGLDPSSCLLFLIADAIYPSSPPFEKMGMVLPFALLSSESFVTFIVVSS